MRALSLDFQPRRHTALVWATLAAGVLLGLLVACAGLWLDGHGQQQEQRLRQSQQRLNGGSAAGAPLSPAESRAQQTALTEMKRVSAQLRRPWEQLFGMLEALPRDDIALLSLAPDARKGQLRISAEARDLEAMLAFHQRLEASAELSDVSLLNHEVKVKQPERPILFNLLATWEVGDARP
ncbi:pilus assembly protein [Pseudomonas citronellolis]|jgi:Tfp pilus assembly protein PilN|uniref:pilus assembly protein n=1 Tax=Pseudomonas citronellolis TaxID=53408 RepID=UPI00226DB2BA|nr:pilus assembly protein [Pseudomonas citronellolis]WAB90359.1 pilus assembly protein [Pseudomonas citronellolis]